MNIPDSIRITKGIEIKEIHGYRPELGLRVFTDAAMGRQKTGTAMGGMRVNVGKGKK